MNNVSLPEYIYVEYIALAWLGYVISERILRKVAGILTAVPVSNIFCYT